MYQGTAAAKFAVATPTKRRSAVMDKACQIDLPGRLQNEVLPQAVFRSTLVSIAETERRPPVRLDDHEAIRDGGAILGNVDAETAQMGK